MSIREATLKAESMCARQSIHYLSCHEVDDNTLYVHAHARDKWGEIWVMRFDDDGAHNLSECILRFPFHGEPPKIPHCIISDVVKLNEWMHERTDRRRGLAVDPTDYSPPYQKGEGLLLRRSKP